MSGTSLTVLSRRYLEKLGYTVELTEHFNAYTMRKNDLLGIGDLLALNGEELLLVQVTSRTNLSARIKKAQDNEKLSLWLSAGGKIIFHGWDKDPKTNYRRWRIQIRELKTKQL